MIVFRLKQGLSFPFWYDLLPPEHQQAVMEIAIAVVLDRLGILYATHTLHAGAAFNQHALAMVTELANEQQFVSEIFGHFQNIALPEYEGWLVRYRDGKIAVLWLGDNNDFRFNGNNGL